MAGDERLQILHNGVTLVVLVFCKQDRDLLIHLDQVQMTVNEGPGFLLVIEVGGVQFLSQRHMLFLPPAALCTDSGVNGLGLVDDLIGDRRRSLQRPLPNLLGLGDTGVQARQAILESFDFQCTVGTSLPQL
ncbi:hypothetical protein D3C85_1419740 [compost metagenome]